MDVLNYPFFTPEHRMFFQVVDRFVERECPREYARQCDGERRYPEELAAKVAAQGWLGLLVPEELGGLGADTLYYTILNEGLARYAYDTAAFYGLITFGIQSLVKFGTVKQQQQYLPPAIRGELRFCIAITEPDVGSDAAAISLRAQPDRDGYLLNGQKVFTTGAHLPATLMLVAARTGRPEERHKGITLFLVPNNSPGLEIRRLETLGRRSLATNEVFFNDVFVPVEQVLGGIGSGWKALTAYLEIERIGAAAIYIGNGQTAVNDSVRYARERKQFGRAIGEFQAISHLLVEMQTRVDAARLLVYQAAWKHSQGLPCTREVAQAKLFASEMWQFVTTQGMQVLGGYSQLPEYDMERYWRDAKVATIDLGSSQIQRNIIARLLGL